MLKMELESNVGLAAEYLDKRARLSYLTMVNSVGQAQDSLYNNQEE